MSEPMRSLTCPSCGREIRVPAELDSFSCVYCGAKHSLTEFSMPRNDADEADRAFAEEHLLDCIRLFPKQYKQFTRKRYEESFRAHRNNIEDTYLAMDRYVCAQPSRREELLDEFVSSFLRQWDDFHRAAKKGV